jgi:coproporphyrinogen III oxidase-like Fe-S oxidoreductase
LFCNGIAEITQISDLGSRISDLQNDGLVEIRPSRLIVTPLGRLFIRNIASALDEYLDPSSTFSKAV